MKTEDERSQKNIVKKMKKHKTKAIHCVIDNESPAELEREGKKPKKVKEIDVKQEICVGSEKDEITKKKKKRKINCDTTDLDVKHEEEEGVIRKKKKKQLVRDESQLETVQILVNEVVREKKQKNKKKNKFVEAKQELDEIENGKNKVGNVTKISKKENGKIVKESTEDIKKTKKKKKKHLPEETTKETEEIITTKKKKKVLIEPDQNGMKTEKDKVKKKKKEAKTEAKSATKIDEVECPNLKNKRSKKEEDLIEEELQEGDITLKKKGKKSTKHLNNIVVEGAMEPKDGSKITKEKRGKKLVETVGIEKAEQKKRKNVKSKGVNEDPAVVKCEDEELRLSSDTASKKSKKQKKCSARVDDNVEAGLGAEPSTKKKKKIKKEKEDHEELKESSPVDVVFLSEKTGNSDELIINQERRRALQVEIDRASQPQKPAKTTGLGQWSTAQFSNSEQQQKFLRLMGGFKKSFQPAAESTGGANMAMGKDAQEQLQQGLLGEFERAHPRRMDFSNRGVGLGYSAPLNKKFSIDVNACRSVRFDD